MTEREALDILETILCREHAFGAAAREAVEALTKALDELDDYRVRVSLEYLDKDGVWRGE